MINYKVTICLVIWLFLAHVVIKGRCFTSRQRVLVYGHQTLTPPFQGHKRHLTRRWFTSTTIDIALIKPWWEDDLPNILGINPLEAAVIFGVLYYLYGPSALYDFAREAGKAFSTYAPVVKTAVTDIFNEFKDYMEEDQEREELRQNGVDVENLPRRTTNIIERFQQTYESFDGESSALAESENILKDAYGRRPDVGSSAEVTSANEYDMASEQAISIRDNQRKSKRDVLLSKNVDIEAVKDASVAFGTEEAAVPIAAAVALSATPISETFFQGDVPDELDVAYTGMGNIDTRGNWEAGLQDDMMWSFDDPPLAGADFLDSAAVGGEIDANARPQVEGKSPVGQLSSGIPTAGPLGYPRMNSADSESSSNGSDIDDSSSNVISTADSLTDAATRFQQQMSGQWNANVVQNQQPTTEERLELEIPDIDLDSGGAPLDVLREIDREYMAVRAKLLALIEEQTLTQTNQENGLVQSQVENNSVIDRNVVLPADESG